jgi:hypothetical protein
MAQHLGGGTITVEDDCRLSLGGMAATLRPAAAMRLAEAMLRAAVKTATREAALSVEAERQRS